MINLTRQRLMSIVCISTIGLFFPTYATIEDRIEYKVNRNQRLLEIINNEVEGLIDCSCKCTVILPENFRDANGVLSQTFVIDTPGNYCLGANINFEPISEFTPAIQILSDDVHLDLRNFTLSQANTTANSYGILIGQGYSPDDPNFVLSNIIITNGNIINFSAIGILCFNSSFNMGGNNLPFESVIFSALNILECGSSPSNDFASGISLDSFADNTLHDPATLVAYKYVVIENCMVNACVGNNAIAINTGDNVLIKNVHANDLTSTNSSFGAVGAYYITARNLQMFDCQGNGTKDLDPAGTEAQVGSFIQGCVNVYIKDSQFNDTFGEADAIVNFNCSNSQNFIAENCQFNNAQGGEAAQEIAGIHMSDLALQETEGNGMKFINCQFNGARVSDTNPGGDVVSLNGFLAVTLRNIVFENCQASNIITTNPNFRVFGFILGTVAADPIPQFSNVRNISFNNCIASDLSGSKAVVGFDLFGGNDRTNRIGEQPSLDNMVIQNCIAERISSSTSTEVVAGIANENAIDTGDAVYPALFNLFVKDCRVSDVRSNTDTPSPLSAGIVAYGVNRPVICNNSVSDCDRGILLSGNSLISPNNLFQLAATPADAVAFPPIFIDLENPLPASAPSQSFFNSTQGNGILVSPSSSTISVTGDYILSPTDLNILGWEVGDTIFYDNMGGGNIMDLVTATNYYLIVYSQGFAQNGIIQNNEVDNCSVAGYQDDLTPNTTSAWIDNVGFNDGTPPSHAQTYDIVFAGVPPIDAGTLAAYPAPGNKYYNLSLIP